MANGIGRLLGSSLGRERFQARAQRARKLATRYPAAAQALEFFAAASEAQAEGLNLEGVHRLLRRVAPEPLASLTVTPEEVESYLRFPDPSRLSSVAARILLEQDPPVAPQVVDPPKLGCPRCGHPAQLGVLRPVAEGAALAMACSLCRQEWGVSRRVCPVCESESLEFYSAADYPATLIQMCGACKTYFHILDVTKDPELVPEADEIAGQPFDVWAMDQGYVKIFPNWVGL
ncbi:MAG: formate dehydrogenase accessory protein FdhE [Bryobacteraceae bacterium]|nr:formate dehydrogenase accessory protein FdhE [Bryobacteraceae bacterium]MDW8377100.1 formate dehydrogenase accessory protein FdhE [Bryobacterales bacterium]